MQIFNQKLEKDKEKSELGGDASKRPPKEFNAAPKSATYQQETDATSQAQIPVNVEPSQGGIFTSFSQPVPMLHTPLGVQPNKFSTSTNHTTTLKNLVAAAEARKEKLKKKPEWKI